MATRKIHFFTGKGGVGKSVVSSAFSLAYAMKKKEDFLLAELSDENTLSSYFDATKATDATEKFAIYSVKSAPNLKITHWNTRSCLNEYALSLLKSEKIAEFFLNNSVSKALINSAPGLTELALLGKATSGPRNVGLKMSYDEIFIDSFSTGHFLSLITTPQSFAETFRAGPIAKQSQSIDALLKDKAFTEVHIVALSDKLVLSESYELYSKLKDLGLNVCVHLNKYLDLEQINFPELSSETKKYFTCLAEEQRAAEYFLQKNKINFSKLPFVPTPGNSEVIKNLSVWIQKNALS